MAKKSISSKVSRNRKKSSPSGTRSKTQRKAPTPARKRPSISPPRKRPKSRPTTRPASRPTTRPASRPRPARAGSLSVERESQAAALRTRWERLAGLAALAALYDRLEDMTGIVGGLRERVADLRARGYYFGRGWEEQTATLQEQWGGQREDAVGILEQESEVLGSTAQDVESLLQRASRNPALFDTADSRLNAFERRVNEAERRVTGSFDQTQRDVSLLQREIATATNLLDLLEGASFRLYPQEHGFAACKAEWMPKGNEPIEGILFLTDSRMLFEQRQELVTKKVLFFATEKKLVQELLWQAPVGGIEVLEIQDKKKFLAARKEFLTLRMEGGDGPPEVLLNLRGTDNEEWARLIRRAAEGQFSAEQRDAETSSPQQELAEGETGGAEQASLPTKCPSCHAALPTIYRGMQQITCEYCGTLINIE